MSQKGKENPMCLPKKVTNPLLQSWDERTLTKARSTTITQFMSP